MLNDAFIVPIKNLCTSGEKTTTQQIETWYEKQK